jgi:DNA-binding beta-propeller fold protein YncE
MKRFLGLGSVLCLWLICSGCGDTFRPIIIPNPPTFPNPAAAHTVLSINDNAPPAGQAENALGSAMVVDVTADAVSSISNVGLAPVFAVQQSANQVLVANQSVSGALADSVTKLNFGGVAVASTSTISLPANSAPNFVATTESSQAYVLLPALPAVGVINTNTNNLVNTFAVGNNPYAMAETANGQKLYVANLGDNTVSAFNTATGSLSLRGNGYVIGNFNAPTWIRARSDSQRIYVLNGNGVISTVDTTSTAGPDTVIDASITVPAGASFMFYDMNKNRLYIPGGTSFTMLDVSQSIPVQIPGSPIPICTSPSQQSCIQLEGPSSRSATDPCFSTTPATPVTVVAVAPLPDGSRVYVGAYYEDSANNICPQVTTIDAVANTVLSSTAVPGFPDATIPSSPYYVPVCFTTRFRFMMAAAGDSSRAYLSSCDGGNVNLVDTSTNSYLLNLAAPIGVRPPISGPENPPQNPIFLIAGP